MQSQKKRAWSCWCWPLLRRLALRLLLILLLLTLVVSRMVVTVLMIVAGMAGVMMVVDMRAFHSGLSALFVRTVRFITTLFSGH
jgi:hypothetical protein